ncbi:Serine/threonine-protein phosphatase 7 long form-like protein [Hordeum vulgare]|nr:Serine/threonine-protein phosphatase 7 long form-like protein [Hordeum vulgare]
MITVVPIDGRALTGRVDRGYWEDRVITLISDCPHTKANRASDIPLPWLLKHRSKCPNDVEPRVVEQYTRAYLWNHLTEVVFPHCSGDTALWMFLDFLADWDAG